MLDVTKRRGLKYPDEFFIRFFFYYNLYKGSGRVLELGCGNGNNLALCHAFGWEVVGIDINAKSLADAGINLEGRGKFLQHDLSLGLPQIEGPFDLVLMPGSVYYIPKQAFVRCLEELRSILRSGARLYMRMRLPDDFRYGRGQRVAPDSFLLETEETGEARSLNVFYREEELKTLLHKHLGVPPENLILLNCRFDTVRSGRVIPHNSDLIIWGVFPTEGEGNGI